MSYVESLMARQDYTNLTQELEFSPLNIEHTHTHTYINKNSLSGIIVHIKTSFSLIIYEPQKASRHREMFINTPPPCKQHPESMRKRCLLILNLL